jgi:aspartate aminotransferase-like enzyme
MNQVGAQPSGKETSTFVVGLWGVRYQVKDVARAVDAEGLEAVTFAHRDSSYSMRGRHEEVCAADLSAR